MIKVRGGGPPQDIEVVATDHSKDDKKGFVLVFTVRLRPRGRGGGGVRGVGAFCNKGPGMWNYTVLRYSMYQIF